MRRVCDCEVQSRLLHIFPYRQFWAFELKSVYVVPMLYVGFAFGVEVIKGGFILGIGPFAIGIRRAKPSSKGDE